MDIERLSKMQIVLLTLLVSFVTSMATGIVTVTLMDQAPPVITQTLNRVVERTVERVVPGESQSASVITKETTVVVKEDDLITESIEKNTKTLVRIKKNIEGEASSVLVGLGIIVSKNGIVATDSSIISKGAFYKVETYDGKIFDAEVISIKNDKNTVPSLAFLSIKLPKGENTVFNTVNFPNKSSLKLGQTIIALTGKIKTDVAIGVISGMVDHEITVDKPIVEDKQVATKEVQSTQKETITKLLYIKTNLDVKNILVGNPLVNIFGELIGISTLDSLSENSAMFIPVEEIKSALGAAVAQNSKNTEDNASTGL